MKAWIKAQETPARTKVNFLGDRDVILVEGKREYDGYLSTLPVRKAA